MVVLNLANAFGTKDEGTGSHHWKLPFLLGDEDVES